MILVLIFSISASFATDTNQTDEIQKITDDTESIALTKEVDATSSIEKTNESDEDILLDSVNENKLSEVNTEKLMATSNIDVTDYTSLSSAITQNNTIINIKNDIIFTSRLIISGNNLVIDGNGHTIDCNNAVTAFFLQERSNITLKNINFINGLSTIAQHSYCTPGASGGCVALINCTDFNLFNCNFTHMRATSTVTNKLGSAILVGIGENIFISNCKFTDCTTAQSGGTIEFIRYLITPNTDNYKYTSNAILKDLTFVDCHCPGNGGAIELYVSDSSLINCTFINCYAGGTGGALDLHGGCANTLVENCTFINNTARDGGAFNANDAASQNTTITGCRFIGNSVTGSGGAIRYAATGTKMTNCIFINNTAKGNGGAVFANAANSTVDNCKFENNTAADGSNFYATAANVINIVNCGFDLFYVSDDGTGDGLRAGSPTNFNFASTSIEAGGTIYLIGTFKKLYGQSINRAVKIVGYNSDSIIDLNGTNNRAFTVGANDVVLKGLTFKNSKITGNGGVLLWNGANGVVDSCTFENNTAANGGAIYWAGTKGTVTGSTFNKNTATGNGGAIYWAGNEGTIEASTFTQNNAVYGSAVFLKNGVSTFDLKDTSFTSNVATTSGTVAAEKLTTFSIGGNTFTTNTATSGDNEYYFYDNSPVITSSLVYVSPTGSASSMGLIESSPTTLDHAIDTVIEDGGKIVLLNGNYNFARTINNREITFVGRTGAIITGSRTSRVFTITNSSKIIFEDLTFSDLSFGSTSLDGAISVSSSSLEIKNTKFQTITGSNLASVVTYDATSTGNITGSTFTSNTATNLVNINGNVNITGSTFTSNTARTSSVSYNSGSKGTVSGTTFSGNSGTYRNLYVNTNNVVVTGSKFDTTASLNTMNIVVYPNNAVLSGTFNTGSNYAFSGISAKNGNAVIATGSVSSNTYSATWTKPLPGTYTITLANTDNKGNTFNYATTPSVSVPVRLTTVYIGPSATGAGTGVDNNNRATWDNVAGILTDTGTVIFAAGTYSNFYGKTINKSWKLTSSGSVTLNANNQERMFTISGNNVQISGLTFQNGKANDSYGSAIHWIGTGGSITNSILTANTGRPITATNTVTISNTQMKDQVSLSKSDINWGSTETITATFAHSAPSKITILFNGVSQGEYSATSGKVTQSYAYNNLATRSVGSYAVSSHQLLKHEMIL